MEADWHDFITADCCRKHFNNVFENEHKTVTNCCDLCDDSLPTSKKPDYRLVRNTPQQGLAHKFNLTHHPEQQLEAKEKVKSGGVWSYRNWRSTQKSMMTGAL